MGPWAPLSVCMKCFCAQSSHFRLTHGANFNIEASKLVEIEAMEILDLESRAAELIILDLESRAATLRWPRVPFGVLRRCETLKGRRARGSLSRKRSLASSPLWAGGSGPRGLSSGLGSMGLFGVFGAGLWVAGTQSHSLAAAKQAFLKAS